MGGKNAWVRMRDSIIRRFEDQDHLTQQRAWFLYMFCFVAFVMFIVLTGILLALAPDKAKVAAPLILTILAVSVAGIVFIRYGRYNTAAYSMLITIVACDTLGFFSKYKGPVIYEGFVSYANFMYIAIIFTTLFCSRKAVIAVMAWFIAVYFTYFFAIKGLLATEESRSLAVSGFADGIIGIVLCSVLSMLIITAMRRANTQLVDSVTDVRNASIKLTEISGIIDTSSQNLANGASDQAASMEETSAMLKEIAEKIHNNTETVTSARKLMQDTNKIVTETNSSLKSLRATMDEVNEASVKIANIVQTIDSIAFQTNLLALNAAVEAARAGEAGSGFAVVADEVRSLARKSAEASKNTQDIISSSIQNIKKSAELAIKSDEAFVTFMNITKQLAHNLEVIGESSEEQSRGISEIEKAVDSMNTVIQSNASGAAETTAVSSELSAMSDDIEAFVHRLDKLLKS